MGDPVVIIDLRGVDKVVVMVEAVQKVGDQLRSGEIDAYHASEAIDELIAEFIDDGQQQDIKGEGQGD